MSVSDQTRNEVWQGFLDAARLGRYYSTLSDRHRRIHQLRRVALLVAAAGGVSAFLNLLPGDFRWIAEIAGALIAVVAIWDLVSDDAKKAAILHTIGVECGDLENQWHDLWSAVDQEDADEIEIRNRIRELADRELRVTARAGDSDIREDRRLNKKSAEIAYKVMTDRYAS